MVGVLDCVLLLCGHVQPAHVTQELSQLLEGPSSGHWLLGVQTELAREDQDLLGQLRVRLVNVVVTHGVHLERPNYKMRKLNNEVASCSPRFFKAKLKVSALEIRIYAEKESNSRGN